MSPEASQLRNSVPSPTPVLSPISTVTSDDTSNPKPKRARTSRPKVKTGCSNCKQRRIKCDEKRPACSNCIRSKKICTGYPPPPRSALPFEQVRIAPRPDIAPQQPQHPQRFQQPLALQPSTRIVASTNLQVAPRRAAKYQQRRITTPPQTPETVVPPPSSSVTIYRPSVTPFAHQEGLYFQLFQSHTANELSGYFDSVFWSRLVLQECHAEVSIRHAVVALGALYKTLDKSCESPPASPSAHADPVDSAYRHWEVAVKSYSNACNSLVNIAGNDSTANRTRLMASVLLACFDSFIGDHKQAIVQIQSGLKLLEQLRAQRRRAFVSRPEEPVEDEIIQMFTRLAIQAKSYDMAFHFPQPYVVQLIQPSSTDPSSPSSEGGSPVSLHQEPIPERFSSLHEARLAWDALCEKAFRFTETMFMNASKNGPMGVLPASLQQFGLGFKRQIESWSDAFEYILEARAAPGVSSQEKAAIAVLKMFQIMGQILFLMTFSDSEGKFDAFQPHFQAIVDLGREVVGDQERRAAERRCPDPRLCRHHQDHDFDIFGGYEYTANHIKPSFSADLGIVPPLYVVATKCRSPLIRRQAIQLLRSSSRREAMWDSELSARIGAWIMDIEEEEDAVPVYTPGPSPEASSSTLSPNSSSPSPRLRQSNGAVHFGDTLGPGGNARWDTRRESTVSLASRVQQKIIPDSKRVMVRAVEFDLREHSAILQCGSRNVTAGSPDLKTRVTKITW